MAVLHFDLIGSATPTRKSIREKEKKKTGPLERAFLCGWSSTKNGQEHAMALIPAWLDRAAGLYAIVSCGTSTSHAWLVDLSQLIMTPTGHFLIFGLY